MLWLCSEWQPCVSLVSIKLFTDVVTAIGITQTGTQAQHKGLVSSGTLDVLYCARETLIFPCDLDGVAIDCALNCCASWYQLLFSYQVTNIIDFDFITEI
jgi:hypothetical protein